jgi:hypothetical protein
MKFLGLASFSAVALLATMGEAQADGGSFVCKDGFGAGTLKKPVVFVPPMRRANQ